MQGARGTETTISNEPLRNPMKRQDYYPSLLPEQVLWLEHFARELPRYRDRLQTPESELDDAAADAAWLAYLLGPCRTGARNWGKSLTALFELAQDGSGPDPVAAPAYQPPPPPEGVIPRPPGALQRVFRMVQRIKADLGSDPAMLQALGLTTRSDFRVHTSTRLRLSLDRADDAEIVIIRGKRWGHAGLLLESRRGNGD